MKYIKINEKKQPLHKLKDFKSSSEIKDSENIAVLIEKPYVVIDIDSEEDFKKIYNIITSLNIKSNIMKTDRGGHFWFTCKKEVSNKINKRCGLTVPVDLKSGYRNSMVTVKFKNKWRKWIITHKLIDEIPEWLLPLGLKDDVRNLKEGEGRNDALFNLIIPLLKKGFSKTSIYNTFIIINDYILKESLPIAEINAMFDKNTIFETVSKAFLEKGKFKHDEFAKWICKIHNIKYYDRLYIYKNNIYYPDLRFIEQKLIEEIPVLTKHRRKETLSYMELIDSNINFPKKEKIVVKNGTLNVMVEKLEKFNPDVFYTTMINCKYDENAYDENVDKMLNQLISNDKKTRELLEEVLGYLLVDHVEYQKAFIIVGEGSNGKSTFLKMIREWLGVENCSSLAIEELNHRFRASALFNKKINLGDDISSKNLADSAMFKSLVTGDKIVLERKGLDAFEYCYTGKLMFTSNSIPMFKDKSIGLSRRLVLIPFINTYSSKDKNYDPEILDKITTENAKSYLLNLAIKGIQRLHENKKFTESSIVLELYSQFRKENNSVIEWLSHIKIDKIINEDTHNTYVKYKSFCLSNGLMPQGIRRVNKTIRLEMKVTTYVTSINGKSLQIWRLKNE